MGSISAFTNWADKGEPRSDGEVCVYVQGSMCVRTPWSRIRTGLRSATARAAPTGAAAAVAEESPWRGGARRSISAASPSPWWARQTTSPRRCWPGTVSGPPLCLGLLLLGRQEAWELVHVSPLFILICGTILSRIFATLRQPAVAIVRPELDSPSALCS